MARREPERLLGEALAHADSLYNFARHLSHDPVVAEDLVQETYARAIAATQQFSDGTNLKAWLFRILRNTYLDLYRRAERARTDGGLDDAAVPAVSDEPPKQEQALMTRELERALATLGDEAREAVLLDLAGFSEAEMADCLGSITSA